MNEIKEKLLEILKNKQNKLTDKIIQNIDLFDEKEVYEMYLILHQTDVEKLKEAWHYKNNMLLKTIDKINMIWFEINKIEKEIIVLEESRENSELLQVEHNLNLAF